MIFRHFVLRDSNRGFLKMIKSLETFKDGGYLPLKSPRGRQLDTRGLEKVEIHSMRNVQTKLMKT